ncbi:MAG TPA: metallophosphoesterase [Candidatus Limnocylindria bacterium]|jgi:Icc-related predicted phosphoesterase|nr:metallophosphoesterase [Candidatus Limnocylindria bacterium]
MTKILAIADEVDEAMYTGKLERLRPDLVVSAGDLPFDYLEYIVSRLNVPLVYVPGNHDPELRSPDPTWAPLGAERPLPGPQGCENVDGRVVVAAGLRIAGLGGSMRYKPGSNQYSDAEMRWRALSLEVRVKLNPSRRARKVDVLLTHSPPLGWGQDDLAHRGFSAFVRLVKDLEPKVLVHGHVHPFGRTKPERLLGTTQIINAVSSRLLEI